MFFHSCINESKFTCLRWYTNRKQTTATTPKTKNLKNNSSVSYYCNAQNEENVFVCSHFLDQMASFFMVLTAFLRIGAPFIWTEAPFGNLEPPFEKIEPPFFQTAPPFFWISALNFGCIGCTRCTELFLLPSCQLVCVRAILIVHTPINSPFSAKLLWT